MKYQGITIHKNKSCTTWYARYRQNGKQFYVSARNQQECYNKLKSALKDKTRTEQKAENKNNLTFIEWLKIWYETYKKDKVKETTTIDYKSSAKYLGDLFSIDIREITNLKINEILNKITFKRRKQKVYELLKDIFNRAEINGLIQKTPIIDDKPKYKRKTTLALSLDDQNKFESYCKNEKYKIFLIALLQGLRKGEALALTKKDFDLVNKTLTIGKSLNTFNKIDTTKNEFSNRTMPLFDKTIQIVTPLLNKLKENEKLFNYSQKTCDTLFSNLRKENNLNEKYTIQSLRTTFVSNAKDIGIPEHIIQTWVGHNIGSQVTSRNYTQVREKADLKYFNILNETKFYSNSTHF